jgi:hypothetical protein
MNFSSPTLVDPFRGIENILYQDTVSLRLPDLPDFRPAEVITPAQLDNFLSLPTLDDYISTSLRALLHDASILTPKRFRSVLISTAKTLRDLAKHNPKMARHLGRLAFLLDEDQDLFDLLQIYRSALVQG